MGGGGGWARRDIRHGGDIKGERWCDVMDMEVWG